MDQTNEPSHDPSPGERYDAPWEPPLSGTEVEHLLGSLTRLRNGSPWGAMPA